MPRRDPDLTPEQIAELLSLWGVDEADLDIGSPEQREWIGEVRRVMSASWTLPDHFGWLRFSHVAPLIPLSPDPETGLPRWRTVEGVTIEIRRHQDEEAVTVVSGDMTHVDAMVSLHLVPPEGGEAPLLAILILHASLRNPSQLDAAARTNDTGLRSAELLLGFIALKPGVAPDLVALEAAVGAALRPEDASAWQAWIARKRSEGQLTDHEAERLASSLATHSIRADDESPARLPSERWRAGAPQGARLHRASAWVALAASTLTACSLAALIYLIRENATLRERLREPAPIANPSLHVLDQEVTRGVTAMDNRSSHVVLLIPGVPSDPRLYSLELRSSEEETVYNITGLEPRLGEILFVLPTGALPPGRYLLTLFLDVTPPSKVREWVLWLGD